MLYATSVAVQYATYKKVGSVRCFVIQRKCLREILPVPVPNEALVQPNCQTTLS